MSDIEVRWVYEREAQDKINFYTTMYIILLLFNQRDINQQFCSDNYETVKKREVGEIQLN